jgi:hypothetical protein
MKKMRFAQKTCALTACVMLMFSCTKDEIVESPTEEKSSNTSQRIDNTWTVQVNGTGNNPFDIFVRYRYEILSDGNVFMRVSPDDKPFGGRQRTELRGNGEWNIGSNHTMSVTLKINELASDTRVVIGQIFSADSNGDFMQVFIDQGVLKARGGGQGTITLRTGIKSGSTISFIMKTNSGTTTVTSNKKTLTSTDGATNCYFKTGLYLLKNASGSGVSPGAAATFTRLEKS